MLKLYPLFSGSSGNMYFIESHKSNILVDIGVSYKTLVESLNSIGKDISDIDALFVTHEHSDHIKGIETFVKKTSIPVFASLGTCSFLKNRLESKNIYKYNLSEMEKEVAFKLKDISITPFETSHDASMPFGFHIQNDDSCLTIATDLGFVSENIYNYLSKSNLSVIESNYDRELLLSGPYFYPLKQRIRSEIGHLSNEDTAKTILNLALGGKRDFILGHLSENNNNPDIALNVVSDTLLNNGFNLAEFNINVASRHFSDEVYHI